MPFNDHTCFKLADVGYTNLVRTGALTHSIEIGYAWGKFLPSGDCILLHPGKGAEEFDEEIRATQIEDAARRREELCNEIADGLSVCDFGDKLLQREPSVAKTSRSLAHTHANWQQLARYVQRLAVNPSWDTVNLIRYVSDELATLIPEARRTLADFVKNWHEDLSWEEDILPAYEKKRAKLGIYEGWTMSHVAIPNAYPDIIAKFTEPKWIRVKPDADFNIDRALTLDMVNRVTPRR